MDTFFNILRKILVGTVGLVFAFAVVYVPQPPKQAEAAIPVTVVSGAGTIAGIAAAKSISIVAVKESIGDKIAFMLAKAMISQILQSTIRWINSGFRGSPAFIQDLDQFLLNVADEAAGEFIRSLGGVGSMICEPFRLDIQLALALQYQQAREGRREQCTLTGIMQNIEQFYENQVGRENFWDQWFQVVSRPDLYTPYGQYIAAEGQLNARLINARGQELQIANWGNGFLSNEICEAIEGPSGGGKRCVISTPGRVIAEQLNNVLDTGRQQLVSADEINEVISALLGQIANQALIGAAGLLGLSGGTGFTGGGFASGSYVDELANEFRQNAGSFLEQNYQETVDKLRVQEQLNALSIQYEPRLQAIIDAPASADRFRNLSEAEITNLKAEARTALNDAADVKANTTEHLLFLRPIIARFDTLQRELLAPATTDERRKAILSEQTDLMSRASIYSAYTQARLVDTRREWVRIVGS